MHEYIPKDLTRLNHPATKKPQYAPHRWTAPAYGQRLQMAPDPDYSELIDQKRIKFIQTVVGLFLYYARALDPTMLCALNEISCIQARSSKDTMAKAKWFLDKQKIKFCPHASFHDEIGQLCISTFPSFLYFTMDLRKTFPTRAKQYSVKGILKSLSPHYRKVSSELNSALMTSFHDEIRQLCTSPFPSISIPQFIWANPSQQGLKNTV